MRNSKIQFVRSLGYLDPHGHLYSALMLQPRIVGAVTVTGLLLQTPWLFLAPPTAERIFTMSCVDAGPPKGARLPCSTVDGRRRDHDHRLTQPVHVSVAALVRSSRASTIRRPGPLPLLWEAGVGADVSAPRCRCPGDAEARPIAAAFE